MLKKTLMTAAAAPAITAGATTLSTPDANAGISVSFGFGSGYYGSYYGGHYGGYYGGYRGYSCWEKRRVRVSYWHKGHKHTKWAWRTVRVC